MSHDGQESTVPIGTTTYLRCMTLYECVGNVLRAMLDEVGVTRTMDAIRPYSTFFGLSLAAEAKEKLGVKGNDATAVAMPMYWAHCGSSCGNCRPMEIREGGVVVEVDFCPITLIPEAPPEACVAMSHFIAEGVCEAVNPEYEITFTHHLGNHDPCCRYVVRKKSVKLSLDDLGKVLETVPVFELSHEEIEWVWDLLGFGYLNVLVSASLDMVGPDRTVQLATPLSRRTGLSLGNKLVNDPSERNNLSMTRDKLDYLSSVFRQYGNPAAIIGGHIEKEITGCPFNGGAPEVCKLFEIVFNGVCEAINPAYEFAYDRMMTRGDSTCHWVVKKRSGASTPEGAANKELEIDEMLKVLKWRLAKGEISEAEYDRLRDKLSK